MIVTNSPRMTWDLHERYHFASESISGNVPLWTAGNIRGR